MPDRLPSTSGVQVGGRQERSFRRMGCQGMTATAPRVLGTQRMRASPQEAASWRTTCGAPPGPFANDMPA